MACLPDLVHDQQVAALAGQLGAAVLQHRAVGVAGLGCEADDDLPDRSPPDQLGQDVGGADQLQGQRLGLLALGRQALGRAVVGDRGRHDHRVCRGRLGQHHLAELLRALDPTHGDPRRSGQRGRADQDHLGAAGCGGAGQGVALPAAGAVAQEADRVQVLAGAPGADHDATADEVLGGPGQDRAAHRGDLGRLRQAPLAGVGAGEPALGGFEHEHPSRAQERDVGPGGGVLPHLGVHRRGHHDRAARSQQDVGEQVVGQAMRGAGQQVGGGGRDHDELGLLAEPHVRDLVDVGPDVVGDGPAGQGSPGRGADEAQGRPGGDDGHLVTALGQLAEQLHRLVRRDASGDAQDDAAHAP